MTPAKIREKLVEYEKLRDLETLFESILTNPIKCDLVGTVMVGGTPVGYKLPAPEVLVRERTLAQLTTVKADKAAIQALLGVTG